MIIVKKFNIRATQTRMGTVTVMYHDLMIMCDVCLYKNERLWIRMPEIWLDEKRKKRFNSWDTLYNSDKFQKTVLSQIDLTLDKAIQLKKLYFISKKRSDNKLEKN